MNKYKKFALDRKRYSKLSDDYIKCKSDRVSDEMIALYESLMKRKDEMNKAEKLITFLVSGWWKRGKV